MRRLILLRHAKSSWNDEALSDRLRPLARRGRLAAPLMGAWLAETGLLPDLVLCSDSVRTRETWERLRLPPPSPQVRFSERLYHADPAALLEAARATPDSVETLMVIGHEPGLSAFARRLASEPVAPDCARAFEKFPTGACAELRFDLDSWSGLSFGTGRFARFAVPRELV